MEASFFDRMTTVAEASKTLILGRSATIERRNERGVTNPHLYDGLVPRFDPMPIIRRKNANEPGDEVTAWGLARFKAGERGVTERHYHDCDEYVFMIDGRMRMRSEGIDYVVEPGDVLVTRMGDEHEIVEILEDTTYFWLETALRGEKRSGHLHR